MMAPSEPFRQRASESLKRSTGDLKQTCAARGTSGSLGSVPLAPASDMAEAGATAHSGAKPTGSRCRRAKTEESDGSTTGHDMAQGH